MSNSVTGKVHHVGQTETVGANNFQKRLLVIETPEQYPQLIPVEAVKDKVSMFDGLAVGQQVTAHVNLRGREYGGRYYLSAQAWKLDKGQAVAAPATVASGEGDDDLPF